MQEKEQDNMVSVCISVLHYGELSITDRCIDSIRNLETPEAIEVYIVIVNNSETCLSNYFRSRYGDDVTTIETHSNLGFAKGNNKGYDYAKEIIGANIFIALNNDTEIIQQDFLSILMVEFENGFDILSPDVYCDVDDVHQSPLCDAEDYYAYVANVLQQAKSTIDESNSLISTLKDSTKWVLSKNKLFQQFLIRRRHARIVPADWTTPRENIVAQGSAVIFGERYIESMPYAFYPETFMYFEECIQKVICDRNGFTIRYTPSLQVVHHHNPINSGTIKKSSHSQYASRAKRMLESYALLEALTDNPNAEIYH